MAISNTMLFHDNIEINATKLIEKTLNGVANTIYPKLIKVARSNNEPVNEYENNSKLYLGYSLTSLFLESSVVVNDNNKSCPTEVPSITKIIIDISSTKVNDIVNDNDKAILTNETCPTEVPPITNLQDNLFPANKLKTAIINKNLVKNKKRCILDLLNTTEVLTNKISLTTQEHSSK